MHDERASRHRGSPIPQFAGLVGEWADTYRLWTTVELAGDHVVLTAWNVTPTGGAAKATEATYDRVR